MTRSYVPVLVLVNSIISASAFFVPSSAKKWPRCRNTQFYNDASDENEGSGSPTPPSSSPSSSSSSSDLNKRIEDLKTVKDQIRSANLVQAALGLVDFEDMVTLSLVGKATLPTTDNAPKQLCLVLTNCENKNNNLNDEAQPSLLVPFLRDWHLKPVQAAYANIPLSMPILLRLNSLLVNRDESLFDNLPWSSWTIDPKKRNRDASGNIIDPKFHMGKRDAYNVMQGKDWSFKTSSQALSLMAKEFRDSVEQKKEAKGTATNDKEELDQDQLAQRLIAMQLRELEMDIAGLDYQLAVMQRDNTLDRDDVSIMNTLEFEREELLVGLESMKEQLGSINIKTQPINPSKRKKVTPLDIMDNLFKLLDKRDTAPYRGATSYRPYSAEDRTYSSPYDMLVEVIDNQLNAQVIGCVLENTSLFDGTVALGGALVLRRKTAQKSVTLDGVAYDVSNEEEDYGNEGVEGGEVFVVETSVDEVVGVSLVTKVALQIEGDLWSSSSVMAQPPEADSDDRPVLKPWRALDSEMSILVEGQARNLSATERVSPVRIPRSTALLYDALFTIQMPPDPESNNNNRNAQVFPTDNPIKTLAELDGLSNEDKAKTLISMSNFQGSLPRPRVVRQAEANKGTNNPLDELLLPLIDESVRRQYLIRDAEDGGDLDMVRELREKRSARQIAQEAAEQARALGQENDVQRLEEEAEFLESLKADVTQDEGSYSRFLDRDDWYELERQKHAKKLNKKKFGTLLDGIE